MQRSPRFSWTVALLPLGHGADIETKGNDGNSPLHRPPSRGKTEFTALLLDRGADIGTEANISKLTPIQVAEPEGNTANVKLRRERSTR